MQTLGGISFSGLTVTAAPPPPTGKFVAVSDVAINGTYNVATSSDGINWTGVYAPLHPWTAVGTNGNIFIAGASNPVSSTSKMMYSYDTVNWTAFDGPFGTGQWRDIVYGDKFVITGWGSMAYSTDGLSWTKATVNTGVNWEGIAYSAADGYATVGQNGAARVIRSPNGINWNNASSVGYANPWLSVAYGNGVFVAVAQASTHITSTDGFTWTGRNTNMSGNARSIHFSNGQFVVVGDNGTILTSTDGINWTTRTSNTSAVLYDVTYGNGTWVASGHNIMLSSTNNAVSWTVRTPPALVAWKKITHG